VAPGLATSRLGWRCNIIRREIQKIGNKTLKRNKAQDEEKSAGERREIEKAKVFSAKSIRSLKIDVIVQ